MAEREFRKHLEQLKSELEGAERIDEETRQLLEELGGDIHEVLESLDEEQTERRMQLKDRLNGAVVQLEESHPELANTMRTVINTLSNMGI